MNRAKLKEKEQKSKEEISGLSSLLKRLRNRIIVSNLQSTSIVFTVEPLGNALDFLVHLKEVDDLKWRTIKLYVAGLRYYYQEIVGEIELAAQIPYPKEKLSLPQVMSREELSQLFSGCLNLKRSELKRP
jgi:site-specific recombinase XerD